jgi:hypothetical protein
MAILPPPGGRPPNDGGVPTTAQSRPGCTVEVALGQRGDEQHRYVAENHVLDLGTNGEVVRPR